MAGFRLVAGLGNPGGRYADTRHNLGFMVLDQACRGQAAPVQWQERFQAAIGRLKLGSCELLLVKPLTYMNLSGTAVRQVMGFFKILPEEVVVVHDDLDLPYGALRLRRGAGDGGHKGARSITAEIGTAEYVRLRCGVGRPPGDAPQAPDDQAVAAWVLEPFAPEERQGLEEFLKRAVSALETLCCEGLGAAQNRFNREG